MKELPLKSDEQMRGDNFARDTAEKILEEILYRRGLKEADKINKAVANEKCGKNCKCVSCSKERQRETNAYIEDFNWTMDMLVPEKRGKEWIETFNKPKGWDIRKVIIKEEKKEDKKE